MKNFMIAVVTFAASTTWACSDFSGIYFDEDGRSCLVAEQTKCESIFETSYFRTAPPLTINYITDGQLRRYPVERSMQKAISYDGQGRQVFLGLDDNNGRIDGLYEKLPDGNIHMDIKWTDITGEVAELESLLVLMPSLESCKKRL